MRVLITGVSGFVGTACALELFERGMAVTGVSRSAPRLPVQCDVHFIPLDLCEPEKVQSVLTEVNPDVLLHLATSFTAGADANLAAERDNAMWLNLASAGSSVERVVIASTELGRTTTAYLNHAQKTYVATKAHIEQLALAFYQRTRIPTLLYRFPHIAGATEHVRDKHDGRILNRLLRSAMGIDPEPVEIYVPPTNQLRYLHIHNATEILVDRVEASTGFAIDECGSEAVAVDFAELVHVVERVVGAAPVVRWNFGRPERFGFSEWRLSKVERMVRDTFNWLISDARNGLMESEPRELAIDAL